MRSFIVAILIGTALARAAVPERIIFDTDVGNDVDDALALAMLHAFENRGEAKLLAVTITKDNRWSAPFIDVVNTFYGRPSIPVGIVRDGKEKQDSDSTRVPVSSGFYPHKITESAPAPDAAEVLRKALESAPDGSVTIVQVGFSTNLARLLASPGGTGLAKRKVKLAVLMAGWFPRGTPEYNVKIDIPAARKVFEDWPTPLVTSGFEVGQTIKYPARSIERDLGWVPHHPIADAYRYYMKMPYDRETWDLTAVLYAVRPDRGYFDLSPPGTIQVDDQGVTSFHEKKDGTRRYLIVNDVQRARILEAFLYLVTEPRMSR